MKILINLKQSDWPLLSYSLTSNTLTILGTQKLWSIFSHPSHTNHAMANLHPTCAMTILYYNLVLEVVYHKP
jgi:hypothetical protein